jgi:DNA-binding HxlR family transcriptional regulator
MCQFEEILGLFTSKWKLYILGMLVDRPKRFGELNRSVVGISKKVLTQNLRELEEEGLISRKVAWDNSLCSVEYKLTESGVDFCSIIESMIEWGNKYLLRDNEKTNAQEDESIVL